MGIALSNIKSKLKQTLEDITKSVGIEGTQNGQVQIRNNSLVGNALRFPTENPVGRVGQAFLQGGTSGNSFGLVNPQTIQPRNTPEKVAQGVGWAVGAFNPYSVGGKALGALGKIGGAATTGMVSRFTPQATGAIAKKILPVIGQEVAQTAGYGVASKALGNQFSPATDLAMGLGMRGIPGVSGAARGLFGRAKEIDVNLKEVDALRDAWNKARGADRTKILEQIRNAADRNLAPSLRDKYINSPSMLIKKMQENLTSKRPQFQPTVLGFTSTKPAGTPQLNTPTGKPSPSAKVSLRLSRPTTPSLEPQTSQIESASKQSTSPLDEIIQQGRSQIGRVADQPKRSIKQVFDDLYTQWVDRYNPIVKASQQAKKTLKIKGTSLRPEADPEYLVRRLTGAGGIADYRFKTEMNPILKQMEKLNIPKEDMDVYLANKRIAGFGTAGRDIYGADPAKASEIVSALEQKYGANIQQIANQLYTFQNKGFQEMIDAGFLSLEAAKIIKQQNPDYSPLYRVMDEVDNYLGLPTRKTMQGSQPVLKIKGSDKKIESPIESIIGNIFKQRAAIEKNRVAKSIVGLQEIAPELGFSKASKSGNDTITIWNNGKKEYWRVDTDIADVAKGVNEEAMNMVLKILQAPAALLRQGATGRNPEFMIPNIIRDQLDAGMTSKYGYIPFVDFVSGLKSMLTNDEVYKKWQRSGAKIDLGELSGRKSIQQLFDEKKARNGLFRWLGAGLDFLGQYSEQPTRVGLFKKAYNKTGNELIAAMESRDATVDFARMGSKMKVANSIVPFLNVGVQGFDKLMRSVKNNPGKVMLNLGIYAVAPQVASTIYNLTQHPEEYAEIPEYEKQSNFVFVIGRNENGTVDYVTVPKGNIVPMAANPVQSFLEYLYGQDKTSFGEVALSTLSETLPVVGQGSSLKEIGIKTIGGNLPQAVKPLTENLLNKSFYKYNPKKEQTKEIVPYYLQKEPAYQQTYKFTPQMYQKIGAVFNISPLQVQNLMEGYLAGYTKIPAQIIESLYKISDNQELSPNDKTIIRRFIKQTYSSSGNVSEPVPEVPGLMERLSGKASAADGDEKIQKYSDGTVKMKIGGKLKSFNSAEDAQTALKKYNFEKENGEYDYKSAEFELKKDRLKRNGDSKSWIEEAEKYADYLTQYVTQLDPNSKEYLTVTNKLEDLQVQIKKYKGYGGFTKTKKGTIGKIKIKAVESKASSKMPIVKFASRGSKLKLSSQKRSTPKLKLKQLSKPRIKVKSSYYNPEVLKSK